MEMKTWHVFINPMTAVAIQAERLTIMEHGLIFEREGRVIAQFSEYLGWFEVIPEKVEKASAQVLTLVPKGDNVPPPAA